MSEYRRAWMWTWVGVWVLFCFAAVGRAETVDKLPPPTSYVSDFAGVIDADSKAHMEQLCAEVDHQAHAQIAVVTIHTLEGDTAADFANRLEEKWRVGPKGTDKGVLMLFAIDDRQRWIEVGYGLEGVLNDAKVGDIGRSMRQGLEAGQYGPAIYGGLRQIAGDIAADAGVTLTTPMPLRRQPQAQGGGSVLGGLLRMLIPVLIIMFLFSRRGGRGGGGGGGGLGWFVLGNVLGSMGGGQSSGGFDGGGSDDGGGDGGGGFGGFGGGSSGGGGAGGDWLCGFARWRDEVWVS